MSVTSEAINAVANRRANSLTAIVRSELERMILSGELKSGQRLIEQQLASQLDVSRGPVREALRALERAGLVTGVDNLGMFVRQVGIEEAIEVILTELGKVATEPVADHELERSKEWLIGSQTMRQQRNMSQAMEYGVHEVLGFGYKLVDEAPKIIQRVTKEDIVTAAAGVFDKSKAVFVKLVPELEEEVARD